MVVPSWWELPVDPARSVLRIDPGMAFGTGVHATTSLAWRLLEGVGPIQRLLDVGAGTGVLGLGALLLGRTSHVVATEMSPPAMSASEPAVLKARKMSPEPWPE